nr:unnamed protein product [Callosobruchus chinensis]
MDTLLLGRQQSNNGGSPNYDHAVTSSDDDFPSTSMGAVQRSGGSTGGLSVSSEPTPGGGRSKAAPASLYHGSWPHVERPMWSSEPTGIGAKGQPRDGSRGDHLGNQMEVTSVMSFASSSGGAPLDRSLGSPERKWPSQQLEAKMDVVHGLLAVLAGQERVDMGETLLALSGCPESCLAMRQSGCIPLLVQLVQSDRDGETRKKASQALHNLVNSQPDEKLRKRESRVLKLLDQCRAYTEALRNGTDYEPSDSTNSEDNDRHPVQTVAHLMKLSFDEGHRQAICQLGGIHTIASIVETEHAKHSSIISNEQHHCVLLRRYACMALTNLTFGDGGNKALLCSLRDFMRTLVVQLRSSSDELRQVTASVLRNLSWRADSTSKEVLREVGAVTGLMKAAMMDNKENTLKSILSALWNLSAHCTENKSEICAVEGALGFLVDMLTYKTPSKSLAIIENSGGILRNISSQIAVREDYREVLRKHNCLQVLLDQLKSPSLTIVSNACGTLWNLSAKSSIDQELLWQMGAPAMLRSLNHSKHKMIAMGSSAALKNLLSAKPQQSLTPQLDSTALALDLPALPTLGARKQKALLQDLDQNLSETYENIDKDSPVKKKDKEGFMDFLQDSKRKSKGHSSSTEFINEAQLSSNFSSLNLNEPSTSYTNELRPKSRLPQTYGSTSLPYMASPPIKRPNPCTFIPVRNKFSDCAYEDEIDISDQPIDYSQKYAETKLPIANVDVSPSSERDYSFGKQQAEKEGFSIYAETDLDQPTDYSLRYAEDDSDSDICSKIGKTEPQEFVQDTVKTYCTEDTPYETPFNFSTATSMSDLRMDDKQIIDNDKMKKGEHKGKKEVAKDVEEKERCSTEDISEKNDKIPKSELSSGLMSPEKPVNYAEEGTPGYFSRVSSFGSLNDMKNESKEAEKTVPESTDKNEEKPLPKPNTSETKAVKFEQAVNYAEETPLMFSRSSSLASLDSIEQHSIHDDRSSVISDFSRLTSGIVSPSELPDSPTQTVPPSPKPRKTSMEFPSTSRTRQRAPRPPPKPSIFEDNVTKFKEESTPIQFSTATSLSSLTIDDHEEPKEDEADSSNKVSEPSPTVPNTSQNDEGIEKKDAEKETNGSDGNDEFVPESEDDGDEDILAACISDGMQNNRASQGPPTATSTPTSKLPQLCSFKFAPKPSHVTSIPMRRSNPREVVPQIRHPMTDSPLVGRLNNELRPANDTLKTYCTEDTPAQLSHAGSNSDLSLLSITHEKSGRKEYSSDESSNLSGENDNILAECIQSGMPQAKKLTSADTEASSTCSTARLQPSTALYRPQATASAAAPTGGGGCGSGAKRDIEAISKQAAVGLACAKDELASYAVENSPCHFSLRSSLSDLTVDGSVAGLKRPVPSNNKQNPITDGEPLVNRTVDSNIVRERRESLSSVSVESLGSLEAEQALLEQCISSGKPKSKSISPIKSIETSGVRSTSRTSSVPAAAAQLSPPKNVNAASAVASTPPPSTEQSPPPLPLPRPEAVDARVAGGGATHAGAGVADAEEETGEGNSTRSPRQQVEEINATDHVRNGSNKSLPKLLEATFDNIVLEDCLAKSCEDSKIVDNRMLDPDAMIESLDRFTAELVSQASHLNKDDDKYNKMRSSGGDSTWNDENSTNDITFPSISGSAPNVITFSNEDEKPNKKSEEAAGVDQLDGQAQSGEPSNDFSSINTSTMTDSTLIAMEATKMATVFKNEAEISLSITSAASLELDHVQPPSQLNSLTNSIVTPEQKITPRSPKMIVRKKSLPSGLMVRRALSNSLNHGSSLESLENYSISNLDHVNPPSDLLYCDMEGSMTSVASLPSEKEMPHPIFNVKQPFGGSQFELENINPPSLFNEITDYCNSLADIPSEAIGTETELFEDCMTHLGDSTLKEDATIADDEITEFSDAHSATPDPPVSSAESTPKKTPSKPMSKSMMTKQRRNLARDRYKTYTVAAEMVMMEEGEKQKESCSGSGDKTENFVTTREDFSEKPIADITIDSTTYRVDQPRQLTPKERRQANRSRFETQVLDRAITSALQRSALEHPKKDGADQSCSSGEPSPTQQHQSPTRSKLSIRRSFIQKRMENKDRFKTQTLSESSFSPDSSTNSPPILADCNGADIHLRLQREADVVLQSLQTDARTVLSVDEHQLIECETLSLVSNDDDSECNFGGVSSTVNYRTYNRSCSVKRISADPTHTIESPVITNGQSTTELADDPFPDFTGSDEVSDDENEHRMSSKPKIVKPYEKTEEPTLNEEEQVKGIRGRRKPLYSKSNINKIPPKSIKPAKTMTSNLVKNVTSAIKSSAPLKPFTSRQNKTVPSKQTTAPVSSRKASGNNSRPVSNSSSPKTSPARVPQSRYSPKHTPSGSSAGTKQVGNIAKGTPLMERQGTFTKDDPVRAQNGGGVVPRVTSRIPTPASLNTKIPQLPQRPRPASVNIPRVPAAGNSKPPTPRMPAKSASTDRTVKTSRIYNRSTSADSREAATARRIQNSPSTQSLKGDGKTQNGAVKKSSIPSLTNRSNSNTSLNSNGSTSAKKQVTSKIASLWKKIDDAKKQAPKKDGRVWIQPQPEPEQVNDPPRLIRSNTFDNKNGVVMRNHESNDETDSTKRVSRLGSFVVMDEPGNEIPQISSV